MIVLSLPVCPSTNALFANARGKGRIKTAEYKAWLKTAGLLVSFQTAKSRIRSVPSPVSVNIRIGKVNQARDADNFAKACADLLVSCGVISGDNLMHLHSITAEKAFGAVKEGWLEISVSHIPQRRECA